MKISFAATNPCHLHPLASAVADLGAAGVYYSGYPEWKLAPNAHLQVSGTSWRTYLVYGTLRLLPPHLRPRDHFLFQWQDNAFDQWVARHLQPCDSIHALPGQCLNTFQQAKAQGTRVVLNHAMGPVKNWLKIMRPEYERVGLNIMDHCPYDAKYLACAEAEYAQADIHCVASSVVRAELREEGIPVEKIWIVPYGADERIFYPADSPPDGPCKIVFAGQLALRKGIRFLLEALEKVGEENWTVDFCGPALLETEAIGWGAYKGKARLNRRGALSAPELARTFREGTVLVLPSLEEGFGLVVPQALQCGLPCVVSDRVGAKDLIQHRVNGSIFPVGNAPALAEELEWWSQNRSRAQHFYSWRDAANKLIKFSGQTTST